VNRDKPSDLSEPTGDRDSHSQGTFNATVVATLKRHYPERFAT
jgi:hypothetical protein